eukprot:3627256-Pleurochrysis_carterae.AAC.2
MPAISVATFAPQVRSLPQASPLSGKALPFSGVQPTPISQVFVQSCDRFPPALRAKFIAQEQDKLQQDALKQIASLGRKPGAIEKRSAEAVQNSSLSQEFHKRPRLNSSRFASTPLFTHSHPSASCSPSIPPQSMSVPVRVRSPRPSAECRSLVVREELAVSSAPVENLILAPSDPQIANGERKRKRLSQAERLAQSSHSDVQAVKRQRAAEALIA